MHPLASRLRERRAALAAEFRAASPFPHLVLDDFLDGDFCARLVAELQTSEPGAPVRQLGPSFAALDDLLGSRAFLDLLGDLTAIPHLLHDPDYLGAGVHEERGGPEARVELNRHPTRRWHRRLELVLDLSPDWQASWGGCLELVHDPRLPRGERDVEVAPRLDRCVIFETSPQSWHGFTPAHPPPGHTRRLFSACFYAATSPRRGAEHATLFAERPLPGDARAGAAATPALLDELRAGIVRRRLHTERLRARSAELVGTAEARLERLLAECGDALTERAVEGARWLAGELDAQMATLYAAERRLAAAFALGGALDLAVRERGLLQSVDGISDDGWVGPSLEFQLTAPHDLEQLTITGVIPAGLDEQHLTFTSGARVTRARFATGWFEWRVPMKARAGDTLSIQITAARAWCPKEAGSSDDGRNLSWLLESVG